jgi:hypothetical protein
MITRMMEVFAGWTRDSAGEREVVILGDGVAGSISCFECAGTRDWPIVDRLADIERT